MTSRAERIYYDKAHKKLAYARHTVVARSGRVVTYVSYAFLTTSRTRRPPTSPAPSVSWTSSWPR